MGKRKIYSVALIVVVASVLFCGCLGKESENTTVLPEKQIVKIGVQTLVTPELELRYEDKYSEFMGTDVELVQFDAPADLNKALISGSIDFGFMGSANAASGISNGVDGQVIWLLDVIGSAESLVAKKDSGIVNLKDLEGRTVAVPFVSTAHFSLLKALDENDVDISKVEILDMKPNDIFAAWERGDIDAAYVWNPVLGQICDEESIVIVTSEDVANMGAMTADVVMVRREFSDKYPDVVDGFIKAQMYAVDLYYSDPEKVIEGISSTANISVDEAMKQVIGFRYLKGDEQIAHEYLGTIEKVGELADVLKKTADFLVEQGSISEAPGIDIFENSVSGEYIQRVLD